MSLFHHVLFELKPKLLRPTIIRLREKTKRNYQISFQLKKRRNLKKKVCRIEHLNFIDLSHPYPKVQASNNSRTYSLTPPPPHV